MRYLLDTDWILDVIGGVRRASRTLESMEPHDLAVSIVTHGELYEGAFRHADELAELAKLRRFLKQFETLPLTDPIMEIFGRNRSDLRRTGQLIPDLDLLIAATAVHHDLILMTRNLRHFARIPALRIYQPS